MGCLNSRPAEKHELDSSKPSRFAHLADGSKILKLHVVEGKDLLAADSNGLSDPFAIITFGSMTYKTHVVSKNLNPQWNQKLAVIVKPEEDKYGINFSVHDMDKVSTDYLGRTTLETIDKYSDGKVHDVWLDLELVKEGETKKAGKIHFNIQVLTKEQVEIAFWRHVISDFDPEEKGTVGKKQLGQLFVGFGLSFSFFLFLFLFSFFLFFFFLFFFFLLHFLHFFSFFFLFFLISHFSFIFF